ncbi:MAG: hypothetical protein HQ594_04690, partial [Candidatus Omnitrophica bacterium]|nr:hypothetical protein [Candidatus Omnitrophota bacterium]
INDIVSGDLSREEAFSEEKRKEIMDAVLPFRGEDNAQEVEKAWRRLEKLYGTDEEEEFERNLEIVTGAVIFDVEKRHGSRSVSWQSLEELGLFEVETVDSIQGAENDVVILSLVRSNEKGNIGFLGTSDGLQRLNVAFSRAREKFTVIGDLSGTLTKANYTPRKRTPYALNRQENTFRAREIFKKTLDYSRELKVEYELERGERKSEELVGFLSETGLRSKDDKDIIIALDTKWFPDREGIEGLVSAIFGLSGKDNIIIVKGEGAGLAGEIEKVRGNTDLGNILILGGEETTSDSAFNDYRNKSCFVTVDPSELYNNMTSDEYTYIRIVEMLLLASTLAFGEGYSLKDLRREYPAIKIMELDSPRAFILIPDCETFPLDDMKKIYNAQAEVFIRL